MSAPVLKLTDPNKPFIYLQGWPGCSAVTETGKPRETPPLRLLLEEIYTGQVKLRYL